MSIRVAVVDDQSLVRGGFTAMLDREEDIEVVGEAADGASAIELARSIRPDVVLMDIRMPGIDGIAATKAIVDSSDWPVKVIIVTTFDPDEYVYEALRARASGFVLKDISPEDLVDAVRVVHDGGALLSPSITRRVIGQFAPLPSPDAAAVDRLQRLTDRELEVLVAVAGGASNLEIAEALFIGSATVKTHVSRILTKLDLTNRAQAVAFAYETGLVQPGSADLGS